MSMSLRQRLNELASSFTSSVLDAIRGASLEDLLAESSGRGRRGPPARASAGAPVRQARRRGGRLPRRSADDIAQVVERIVGLVRQSPRGLRAEQIRQKLGLQAKELPRPLTEALDSRRLAKSGQKRATTYFVKGSGGASKPTGRASEGGTRARRAPAAHTGRKKGTRHARAVDKMAARAASGRADAAVQGS